MSVEKCNRCGKKRKVSKLQGQMWYGKCCDECNSFIKNFFEEHDKKREQELEREREIIKLQYLALKKIAKKDPADPEHLCPICGTVLEPGIPKLIADDPTRKVKFKVSWRSVCLKCLVSGKLVGKDLKNIKGKTTYY